MDEVQKPHPIDTPRRKGPARETEVNAETRRSVFSIAFDPARTLWDAARMNGLRPSEAWDVFVEEACAEMERRYRMGVRMGKLSMSPNPLPPAPGVVPIKRRAA